MNAREMKNKASDYFVELWQGMRTYRCPEPGCDLKVRLRSPLEGEHKDWENWVREHHSKHGA